MVPPFPLSPLDANLLSPCCNVRPSLVRHAVVRPIYDLPGGGEAIIVAVVLGEWQQIPGNVHDPPCGIGNPEQVEMAGAGQHNSRLEDRVSDVTAAKKKGLVVGMKDNA